MLFLSSLIEHTMQEVQLKFNYEVSSDRQNALYYTTEQYLMRKL